MEREGLGQDHLPIAQSRAAIITPVHPLVSCVAPCRQSISIMPTSTNAAFHSIPILDYSLSQGPGPQKTLFLSQLRHAIINVGFLYLKNHSIPASLIDEVKAFTPRFFDLPQEKKDRIRMANSQHFLGYSWLAAEITKGEVDQREQIDIATEFECRYKEGDPIFTKLWGRSQVCYRISSETPSLIFSSLTSVAGGIRSSWFQNSCH